MLLFPQNKLVCLKKKMFFFSRGFNRSFVKVNRSQELIFADTNVQLVFIGSCGYNLQHKPFCDWLTLIE